MTVCVRCHRPLKVPTATGMGPVCGKKAKPIEEHDRDLFGYSIELAAKVARARVALHVEVMAASAVIDIRRAFADARRRLGLRP